MEYGMGTIGIVAVCAGALLIGAMRKKAEWLLNFILRTVLGIIAIYLINLSLPAIGFEAGVGINPVTILTSGILGFPGVIALYAIFFYKAL